MANDIKGGYFEYIQSLSAQEQENYVVTIHTKSHHGDPVTVHGILVNDSVGFSAAMQEDLSAGAKVMEFLRGAGDGLTAKVGGAAAVVAKDLAFGKTATFYDKAITYLSGTLETLSLDIYIDMNSSNMTYEKMIHDLYKLLLPRLGDNLAQGVPGIGDLSVPIMTSGLFDNALLKESLGTVVYNFFDDKLLAISIGKWFLVNGGFWCKGLSTPIVRTVDNNGKPMKFAQVSMNLEYHRHLDYDTFSSWFRK